MDLNNEELKNIEKFKALDKFDHPSFAVYNNTIRKALKNIKKLSPKEINSIYELLILPDIDKVRMAKEMLKTILQQNQS